MQTYSFRAEWSVEDGEYVATSAEFPGATAFAKSADDAIRELKTAIEGIIDVMQEDGLEIPTPMLFEDYSGQFRLRLAKSQHARLVHRAAEDGVSINSLAQTYVAAGLAADLTAILSARRMESAAEQMDRASARLERAARSAKNSAGRGATR